MWDFFISYASEDKSIARALRDELKRRGYSIWFDEDLLAVGDSLLSSIDHGVTGSQYAVVILSRNYFAKDWTQRELEGLVTHERAGRKIIIPVRHEVSQEDVRSFSPIIASRVAIDSDRGVDAVADAIELAKIDYANSNPDPARGLISSRRLDQISQRVLIYTLRESLNRIAHTPDADDVIQALELSAREYAEAVEDLADLHLVRLQGN